MDGWLNSGPKRRFAVPQSSPILPADSMVLAPFSPSIPVCRERVVSIQRQSDPAACVFPNQTKLLLSRSLAPYVTIGDEITFPIPAPDAVGPEILITKNAASGTSRHIYQAPIGYVSQPKPGSPAGPRRQEERVEIQTLGARPASLLFGKLLPAAHLSHRKRRCEWPGIKTAR